MNTKLTNKEIGRLLDRSANQLDRATLTGLYEARRYALQSQRVTAISWVSQHGTLHGHLQISQRAFNWIIAAVVATLLAVNLTYWDRVYDHDHSDIDIQILTDELPIDMYVD